MPAPAPTAEPGANSAVAPAPSPTDEPGTSPATSTSTPRPDNQTPSETPAPAETPTPPPAGTPAPVETPESTPPAPVDYLSEEIAPCTPIEGSTVDPCDPGVTIAAGESGSMSSSPSPANSPSNVRRFLDGNSLISVSHIALRGTYILNTVRCTRDNPYHIPAYEESGYFQNSILMQCYADVRANAYILGTGPTRLTVLVHYLHYWDDYWAGDPERTHDEWVDLGLWATEMGLEQGDPLSDDPSVGIYGREIVLFLGPSHNHGAEVWQVFGTWDVQTQEDGTAIAVHPARDYWQRARADEYQTHIAALEMGLPTFTQAVATAQSTRLTEYGGRIAPEGIDGRAENVDLPMLITDANRLTQYYVDTGAYSHQDGPPTQPPPVPACAKGSAVEDSTVSRPLMRDCSALLDSKDELRRTAALNWSKDLAIASWTGITVSGTPQRVTGVALPSQSLNGTIPSEVGSVDALTSLDLSNNSLTGEIPTSLEKLENLSTLKLSGNSFSGCIPPGLRDVATNDLAGVGLSYCDMLTAPPAPSGLSLSVADSVFTVSWNEVSESTKYEAQHRIGDATDWTALPEVETTSTTHGPEGGLACGTAYRYRVRAFGDGVMHSADWGDPSTEATHNTEPCNQDPVFEYDSYEFTLAEDAAVGDQVGTTLATDEDTGDTVSHSITSGNEPGAFRINENTGEITVATALDHETTPSYILTVQADDGRGGTDAATVNITVSDVAEDLAPAPEGLETSLTDNTFTLTWNAVEGASKYEAQYRTSDTNDWTALPETERTTTTYTPEGGPACGTHTSSGSGHSETTSHTRKTGARNQEPKPSRPEPATKTRPSARKASASPWTRHS